MQYDASFDGAGVLQQGDGGRPVPVGEDLPGYQFLPHRLGHLPRLRIDAQVGGAVQLHHTVGVRLHMYGHHPVVVHRLDAQIGQGVHTEVLHRKVLHIAHIGVDGAAFEIFHVVFQSSHCAHVAHTEVERAARGGVEEGADSPQHILVLDILVGLHPVVGGIDHRGLELLRAALHTEVDAGVALEVGVVLRLQRQGLDDFPPYHVQRRPRKGVLHGVGGLYEPRQPCQHRYRLLEVLDGARQLLGVVPAAVLFQQIDDGHADEGGLGLTKLRTRHEPDRPEVLFPDELDDGAQVGSCKTDIGGRHLVPDQLGHDIGIGQQAEAVDEREQRLLVLEHLPREKPDYNGGKLGAPLILLPGRRRRGLLRKGAYAVAAHILLLKGPVGILYNLGIYFPVLVSLPVALLRIH